MKPSLLPAVALVLCLAALNLAAFAQKTDQPASAGKIEPAAEKVTRAVAEVFQKARTATAKMKSTMQVNMAGLKQEMVADYSLAFERPNRFAIVLQGDAMLGGTIVSDGKQLTTYMPMMKSYSRGDAPATLAEVAKQPETMMSGGAHLGFLAAVLADDAYAAIMEGVTSARHVGVEKLEGVECERLAFSQAEMDWELWVERGPRPVIRKTTTDLSKAMGAQLPAGAELPDQFKNMKMTMMLEFSDWKFDEPLAADAFKYEPPAGAKLMSELDAGGEEENALVGKPAPEFSLELLDGGKADLAQHKGKNVVVLDFWATWCGPCVRALPILTEVTTKLREKGVAFYAVNEREDEKTIRDFLTQKKMKFPVALDRDAKVGELYGVEGIPQTVIIDKQGVVQAVHVGFSPNLKQRLSSELEALIAGKPLASEKKAAAVAELKGLSRVWEVPGRFTGLAADGAALYALGANGEALVLGPDGAKQRTLKLGTSGGALRIANLIGEAPRELLAFSRWGHEVRALDSSGLELWKHPGGQGIDDVWPADLDGDGLDEAIIGYNGGTGLHVLDHQGKPLWSHTKIGNVWHVCAGEIEGGGALEVITTSAEGKVHIFGATGKKLRDLDPGLYGNMVRFAPGAAGQPGKILAGGSSDEGEALVALDASGKKLWQVALGDRESHIDAATMAPGRSWLAVFLRGGRLVVLDTENGAIIAKSSGEAAHGDVAWIETKETPLVVVTSSAGLSAYRVTAQ